MGASNSTALEDESETESKSIKSITILSTDTISVNQPKSTKSTDQRPGQPLLGDMTSLSSATLLVDGYIRQIGSKLSSIIRFIPIAIMNICCDYYCITNRFNTLMYLPYHTSQHHPFYCLKMTDKHFQVQQCKIHNAPKDSQQSLLYFKRNIKLSPLMTETLLMKYNEYYRCSDYYHKSLNTDTYSIIFHRGSDKTLVSAISFNDTEFGNTDTRDMVGFTWMLPRLRERNCSILYSHFYGVISIGGRKKCRLYNLLLNNDIDINEWQYMMELDIARNTCMSSVMIGENRALLVGGCSVDEKSAELINFSSHTVTASTTNNIRSNSGIFYDDCRHQVFVAGGPRAHSNSVEFYDIIQNKWYMVANKCYAHSYRPVLWMTHESMNKLYIAGCKGGIKYMDLRDSSKEWMKWQCSSTDETFNMIKYMMNTSYRVVI